MFFCLFAIFSVTPMWGQQEEQCQYLFPDFQNGRVVLKDGTTATAQLNYSLISNRFIFIDTADKNQIQELVDPSVIGNIIIGSRIFHLDPAGMAIETVQAERPMIFARYSGKSTDRGQESGYGGRSSTSSIKSISALHGSGMVYNLKGDDRWVVTGVDKEYQVERNGKMKRFSVLKQFLKIYPKQNEEAIKKFIDDNSIDFSSVEQVIELCNYAESLD